MKTLLSLMFLVSLPALADTSPLIPVTLLNKSDVQFGTGYDTRKQSIRGLCVDNRPDQGPVPTLDVGQTQGSLRLRFENSESRVADKLNISASGRYQSGVYKASTSADFYNDASKSAFKASYTFVSELSRRKSMVVDRVNLLRPMPGFEAYVKKDIAWYLNCGDEFVNAKIESARLFVNISVAFVSQAEKQHFEAKFGIQTAVADVQAELTSHHEEYSSANVMTVQAYQLGGDPAKLGRLVCPATVDGKPDLGCAQGARAVVNCGFGKIGDCMTMITNSVAYSNSLDGDGFGSQVVDGKNYTVTGLETAPYHGIGGSFFPLPITELKLIDFEAVRNNVIGLFNKEHEAWLYAKSLADNRVPRLSTGERKALDPLQNDIFKKMEDASSALDTCYDGTYEECSRAYKALVAKTGFDKDPSLNETQHAAIFALTKPESFVQYCDMSDSDHPGYQTTVETLRTYARAAFGQDVKSLDSGDSCMNLALWLDKQKEIRLPTPLDPSKPTIGDLGPIAVLKNLEVLSLKGQSIRNVEALKALVGLRELTLDDNLIADVMPLAELPALERLNIQNNQVPSLAPLAKLNGRLQKLDARGNKEGISCPLSSPTSCKIMSFANYADISSAYKKCDEILHPTSVAIDDTHILATGGHAVTDKSARMQVVDNGSCRVLEKSLSVPRVGHTMTMTPNGILVIGGGTNKIERVDLHTLEATVTTGALAENATNHTATLLPDGRVLVVGGASDADSLAALTKPQSLSSLVQFVGTDGKVELLGHLSVPRAEHTATLLNDGSVLIVGGYSLSQMIDIVERIDVKTKTITVLKQTLPFGRTGHTASLLDNGHVLVAGGAQWVSESIGGKQVKVMRPVDQVLDFDPGTNQFRVIGEKLPDAISKAQAITTADHRVLLIGGLLSSPLMKDGTPVLTASKVIQVYDPTTEAFYKIEVEMLNRRMGFTATALAQNNVLIFGGAPSFSYDSTTDKITTDTFTTSMELLVYRPR